MWSWRSECAIKRHKCLSRHVIVPFMHLISRSINRRTLCVRVMHSVCACVRACACVCTCSDLMWACRRVYRNWRITQSPEFLFE
mmetsp:Transcript_14183/g.28449  ORF Transcript_14183/g.28449 Transcript_14183/m.28449 type:complete len:84 (-) Transcript_14183:72-323(-)